jgi:hypothetical protein
VLDDPIVQLDQLLETKAESSAETIEQLHAKIGQPTVANDILERRLKRTHGPRGKSR